jgi:hypothetical protein
MDDASQNCTIPPCQSGQLPLCWPLQRSVIFPDMSKMHLVISYITQHFISIHGSLKEKNSYHLLWLAKMVFATDTSQVKKSQLNLISSGL